MAWDTEVAERRPGCIGGRLLGAAARLVLVYPLVSIASRLGQAAQQALWPQVGTPYEGALVGIIIGAAVGLSLWRSAVDPVGWRPVLAGATLVAVSAIWLTALIASSTGLVEGREMLVPWAACLFGSAGIAALLRL
ncbi:MAG: hypothetical protein ACOX9R_13605 [Armatimonadota bacterium]|jgi:hypothetical protein